MLSFGQCLLKTSQTIGVCLEKLGIFTFVKKGSQLSLKPLVVCSPMQVLLTCRLYSADPG